MSENSDTPVQEVPELSDRRILILMGIVVVVGSMLGFILVSNRFGSGILLGGTLAGINYYWLKNALSGIFEKAIRDGKKPKFLIGGYLLRYVFLAIALVIVYYTKVVDFAAVLAGLASLAAAIMIEGIIRLFSIVYSSREI